MRSGAEMKLSYSGEISEGVIYFTDEDINAQNLRAVNNLIDQMHENKCDRYGGSYKWVGVDGQKITDFLAMYKSHPDSRKADCKLLSQYIKAQLAQGELVDWTVLLMATSIKLEDGQGNDVSRYFTCGLDVGAVTRKRMPQESDKTNQRFTLKRLIGPGHEYADLSKEEAAAALDLSIRHWEKSENKNKSENPPTSPGGGAVRRCRPKTRGLLLLYPLLNAESMADNSLAPVMGFAISFPKSDTAKEISYTVNNIFDKYGDLGD
jgi:hypothetical protein